MDRFKFIKDKSFAELPKTSGVYLFYARGEAIYIGKAINIQSRVKNHFNQPSYKDDLFIDKVDKIGYLETNSEIEALILEANLIKKYQPKFNVVWRDDKNYFYVVITQNENRVPYVFVTHQPGGSPTSPKTGLKISGGRTSVGPFVEGTALKKTLRFLRRVFPYYTSAKHPKNKCTYCHLGLCPGPELMEDPPSPKATARLREYKKNIKKLILILQGKRSAVLRGLKKEMAELSMKKEFEKAGKIRDRISHLQQVMAHTNVINGSMPGLDPKIIGAMSDVAPTLNKLLGVDKNIHRIECYDVSNIQGKFATGSMVVFVDGAPDKSQYKKFKIKLGDKPNDIAMLKEVLTRRFSHKEWTLPEAILIDGGKAQLNIAIKVREQFHRIIPLVISIAKGKQDPRSEARLFIEGKNKPIPLKNLPQEIRNLILQLDSEAHRFAISYHKTLRKKSLLQ